MKDRQEGQPSVPQHGLNARRSGSGPTLVMLHGLFGDGDNFHSVSLHIARHLDVLRIDLPGHGGSPSLPRLGIDDMADRVQAYLADAGVDEFHLLGHSLGGKVALTLAGRDDAPAIGRLIVVDIAPRHYPPHHAELIAAMQSLDLDSVSERRAADTALRDGVPDAGVRAFLLKSLARSDDGAFRWRFDLAGLARDYALICEAPRIERTIDAPTLFIKGGKSDYLQVDDESLVRAVCRRPTLREIAGAGHWLHAEKPDLFTRVCLDFIGTSALA